MRLTLSLALVTVEKICILNVINFVCCTRLLTNTQFWYVSLCVFFYVKYFFQFECFVVVFYLSYVEYSMCSLVCKRCWQSVGYGKFWAFLSYILQFTVTRPVFDIFYELNYDDNIRSMSLSGSRQSWAVYDWLACDTWLRNAQTCICQLITTGDRFSSFSALEA